MIAFNWHDLVAFFLQKEDIIQQFFDMGTSVHHISQQIHFVRRGYLQLILYQLLECEVATVNVRYCPSAHFVFPWLATSSINFSKVASSAK